MTNILDSLKEVVYEFNCGMDGSGPYQIKVHGLITGWTKDQEPSGVLEMDFVMHGRTLHEAVMATLMEVRKHKAKTSREVPHELFVERRLVRH